MIRALQGRHWMGEELSTFSIMEIWSSLCIQVLWKYIKSSVCFLLVYRSSIIFENNRYLKFIFQPIHSWFFLCIFSFLLVFHLLVTLGTPVCHELFMCGSFDIWHLLVLYTHSIFFQKPGHQFPALSTLYHFSSIASLSSKHCGGWKT